MASRRFATGQTAQIGSAVRKLVEPQPRSRARRRLDQLPAARPRSRASGRSRAGCGPRTPAPAAPCWPPSALLEVLGGLALAADRRRQLAQERRRPSPGRPQPARSRRWRRAYGSSCSYEPRRGSASPSPAQTSASSAIAISQSPSGGTSSKPLRGEHVDLLWASSARPVSHSSIASAARHAGRVGIALPRAGGPALQLGHPRLLAPDRQQLDGVVLASGDRLRRRAGRPARRRRAPRRARARRRAAPASPPRSSRSR